MAFEQITTDVSEHILTITLNPWTATMGRELIEAFDLADADDDVRAVIVTGAGRAFCAGADLEGGGDTFDYSKRGPARAESMDAPRDNGGELTLRIFDCKKPVIAAINGPAVGVGATMTLPMDVRLAADDAKMGFVFVRRGIIPEAASSWFLPRVVGISQAMEWVATGRVFPAVEALEAIRYFGARNKMCMVHFRNIKGGFLHFDEVYPDNGDVDFYQAMRIFKDVGYVGMFCPDHVPESDVDPDNQKQHSFCLGYIRAMIQAVSSSG